MVYLFDTPADGPCQALPQVHNQAMSRLLKTNLEPDRHGGGKVQLYPESWLRFSGPESSVDMEVMRGFNGQAVKVLNLPSPVFQDYTQFRSVAHTHTSAAHSWNHQGTNGFTSKWTAAGK